jgi:DNA-binding transcriptional MocR family regulator
MSKQRASDLADCSKDSASQGQTDKSLVIIEDDHSGDIASGSLHSLGTFLPAQTVHIRSFSKSHGPDLRLAAVGGAGAVITGVANRRLLGPGWSSRILQAVLVELLDDQHTLETLDRAREEYASRRRRVVDILSERGVGTTGSDGINLWVAVENERDASMTLAARGIGSAPGEPFLVKEHPDSLRFTVGLLGPETQLEAAALAIADAATAFGANRPGQRRQTGQLR